MDLGCPSFLINSTMQRSVCDKVISSWVRRVFSTAKTHVSRYFQGAVTSAALAAGVHLIGR